MRVPKTIDEVFDLYSRRGCAHYGEDVTQIAHALQCAALAQRDGASDELVCAALLHDIGHLVVVHTHGTDGVGSVDDDHEAVGGRVLSALFAPKVAAPVAMHVLAKRWRCTVDPAYAASLSAASRTSLRLQGGPLGELACRRFEAHPGFDDAVRLRRWDDAAKDPDLSVGVMADYHDLLTGLAREAAIA